MSLNKISAISPGMAKEYSTSATYDVGEYVLYGNAYWKCKTTIAIGEDWNPEHWELDDSPLDTVNEDIKEKAPLVDGKVPAEYLPSYVDDVIEGYYYDSKFYTTIEHTEEITPERGKIYVDITSTSETKIYRWNGSAYIDITSYTDISSKVDKVPDATEDNFASFNSEGGIKDSGVAKDDFIYTREYDRPVTVIVREPHSWEESEPAADRVSSQFSMRFTPSGFGAAEDCYLTSFSVMTSDRGVPVPGTVDKLIYAKVLNSSGGTALMVSEPVSGENMSTSTFYTFTFNSDTKLEYDKEYMLMFAIEAQEGARALVFPVSTSANMGSQQLIYPNGTPNYRLIAKATYDIEVEEERIEHVVEKYKLQQIVQEGTHDENPLVNKEYVDATVPAASTDVPPRAEGAGSAGTIGSFAKGDHVHPAETEVVDYRLPDDCFPMKYTGPYNNPTQHTIDSNDGLRFEVDEDLIFVWDTTDGAISEPVCAFYKSSLKYEANGSPDTVSVTFSKNGVDTAPTADTWPVLEKDAVFVREVRVAKPSDMSVTSVNSKTGAVTLGASDVGALATTGGTMTGPLNATTVSFGLHELSGTNDALIIRNTLRGSVLIVPEADRWDILARLTDIYTAIQQIAPEFTAKTYAVNDLCTYNGVVYRCKSGYTATASSAKPNSDTTHWEAKKVSELFLPLTGGVLSGILRIGDRIFISTASGNPSIVIRAAEGDDYVAFSRTNIRLDGNTLDYPSSFGTFALLENIAPAFSTSATYEVNKLCVYANALYRCTTAITTAGAWDSSKWTAATVQDVLAAIWVALDNKAPLASPAFTGTPTAPNIDAQSTDGQVANKKYVDDSIAGVSVNPLAGITFDFATMQGVMSAVKACAEALGATVINMPGDPDASSSSDSSPEVL